MLLSESAQLAQGKKLIDEDEASDQKYKLVLVGRKVSKDELDFLDETHTLQTEIFRESNEQFSEAVKKDESLAS